MNEDICGGFVMGVNVGVSDFTNETLFDWLICDNVNRKKYLNVEFTTVDYAVHYIVIKK